MALTFRNLTVTPDAPVSDWGVEGILTSIDRGESRDWARIITAITVAPHGMVAAQLEEALDIAESSGVSALLRRALDHARSRPEERSVRRIRELYLGADLTQEQLAARIGTSRTRLNSYLTGRVAPSAVVLQRIEDVSRSRQDELA